MRGYQPISYVPVAAGRFPAPRLAQAAAPPPGPLSPGMVRAALTGGLAVETALGAAGAWVGLWTGLNAKGLLKVLGYGIGAVSAISGVVSLTELLLYLGDGLPVPPPPPVPSAAPLI